MLYDALLYLRYNKDVLVYRARMSMAHSMEQCEVSVTIPLNPTEPWMAIVIGVEIDDTIDQMTHFTRASLCGSHIADTATMPITLFPFRYANRPCFTVWQQRLEAVSDPEGPHFHAGMAAMAEYAQSSFNLQHHTAKIAI
jgi:hypothetical protein